MPTAVATALQSILCISSQTSSSFSPSSNSQQLIIHLVSKTKSILQNHPLYSPIHKNLFSQIKEKILCLEIMGVDSGKALSLNPSRHSTSLHSIHYIIYFLQTKGIRQKDLPRIFGMYPKVPTADIKTDLEPVFSVLSKDLKSPRRQLQEGY